MSLEHLLKVHIFSFITVVLWALSGIYRKQAQYADLITGSVSNFTISLIIATCVLIVLRTLVIIYRHFRRPLYIGLAMASSSA